MSGTPSSGGDSYGIRCDAFTTIRALIWARLAKIIARFIVNDQARTTLRRGAIDDVLGLR